MGYLCNCHLVAPGQGSVEESRDRFWTRQHAFDSSDQTYAEWMFVRDTVATGTFCSGFRRCHTWIRKLSSQMWDRASP